MFFHLTGCLCPDLKSRTICLTWGGKFWPVFLSKLLYTSIMMTPALKRRMRMKQRLSFQGSSKKDHIKKGYFIPGLQMRRFDSDVSFIQPVVSGHNFFFFFLAILLTSQKHFVTLDLKNGFWRSGGCLST